MPGAVATSITENSGVAAPTADAGRFPQTSPEHASKIMMDGIERNRLHIYVGKDARLMSLAIRVAPRLAIGLVRKQMKRFMAAETPTSVP